MEKLTAAILHHKKIILLVILILSIISAYLSLKVPVNYNILDYLPENTPSTNALDLLHEEFKDDLPNLQVVLEDISYEEAIAVKEKLLELPEVSSVMFADDIKELAGAFLPAGAEAVYFKENMANLSVAVDTKDYLGSLETIQTTLPENTRLGGQLVAYAATNKATLSEISQIMLFALPITLVILFISTRSWFEPVIFLLSIFVAILLNLGTNIIFPSISFITMAVASILQMAVSMDYSIFLLNRFNQYRDNGDSIDKAMQKAMIKSFTVILSSASTTFFGFLSLIFMNFLLGPDLGLVLAKGIVFSLLSTFLFLPCFGSLVYKYIDKTSHRSFLPSGETFGKVARFSMKLAPLTVLAVALLTVPFFKAQQRIHFLYGMDPFVEGSKEYADQEFIASHFGDEQSFVLLVPAGDYKKEEALLQELEKFEHIGNILSYTGTIGRNIPSQLIPDSVKSSLETEAYTRFILTSSLDAEGEDVFKEAEKMRALASALYGEDAHWIGESFSLLDMKEVIQDDNMRVNFLTIAAVAVILLLSFRSLSLPVILVFTIEFAIWGNLSTIYLTGRALNYIGYLVVSTIQLGATVDYGILMTENYLNYRHTLNAKDSAIKAITNTMPAILPPGLILSSVGFVLSVVSSLPVVSDIGLVLGQGALASLLSVIFLLPPLLQYLDPLIYRTTLNPGNWLGIVKKSKE